MRNERDEAIDYNGKHLSSKSYAPYRRDFEDSKMIKTS